MSTAVSHSEVRSALVVTAHPDDVDFGAAGTIATWTAAGIKVSYCVCTSGEASGVPGADPVETARVRQAEQLAAAACVGVHDVTFLDHPDGTLEPSLTLRRDITRMIRRIRPDRVLTWSPEIDWARAGHPDHRAVGSATLAAVQSDARNPHAHRELRTGEGLDPWTVRELWLVGAPAVLRNHAVDVTDVFAARVAAVRSHVSQTSEQLPGPPRGTLAAQARRTACRPAGSPRSSR